MRPETVVDKLALCRHKKATTKGLTGHIGVMPRAEIDNLRLSSRGMLIPSMAKYLADGKVGRLGQRDPVAGIRGGMRQRSPAGNSGELPPVAMC